MDPRLLGDDLCRDALKASLQEAPQFAHDLVPGNPGSTEKSRHGDLCGRHHCVSRGKGIRAVRYAASCGVAESTAGFGVSGSTVAQEVLQDWSRASQKFVRVMPIDFKRVRQQQRDAMKSAAAAAAGE